MADAVKEYLFLLKPSIDKRSFENAKKKLSEGFKSVLDKRIEKSTDAETKNRLNNIKNFFYDQENKDPTKTIKSKVNLFKEAFGKIASTVQAAVEVFKQAYAKAKEILDSASEFSRSFVSGSSAFVDTDVRDYMLRFGVGSKQAQSIIAAEEALGIDASDYALLTQGQREAFDQLMQHYQEGLDNLDTEKLEEYNQVMQEYQLKMAEFNMDIKLAFMNLLVNSEPLKRLGTTVTDFLNSVVNILSSDIAQAAFDGFITFLNTLIDVLGLPIRLLGGIMNKCSTNTRNETNYTYNNYRSSTFTTNTTTLQQSTRQVF